MHTTETMIETTTETFRREGDEWQPVEKTRRVERHESGGDDRKPLTITQALIYFGEWLDSEGLTKPPPDGDKRTHTSLAQEFVTYWERDVKRTPLPGRASR